MAMKDPAVIEYDSVRETIGGLIAEPGFSDGDNLVGLGLTGSYHSGAGTQKPHEKKRL